VQLLLDAHKEAASTKNNDGAFSFHIAAYHSDLMTVKCIFEAFPSAISTCVSTYGFPLCCAATRTDAEALSVVQYLYEKAPEMIKHPSGNYGLPAHYAAASGSIETLKYILELYPAATSIPRSWDGQLPLHRLLDRVYRAKYDPDKVRLLLRYNSSAANAVDNKGHTPYVIANTRGFPDIVKRLLLRADPSLNPAELHRLNYAERSMAMFLAFSAISSSATDSFAIRFRRLKTHAGTDMPLLRLVVSFL
jgi:ankyrin repeat protein